MAATLRELRGRIRSAGSIKKITKAQEMIATSRIGKAQARLERPGPTPTRSPACSQLSHRRPLSTIHCWSRSPHRNGLPCWLSRRTAACAAHTTPARSARPRSSFRVCEKMARRRCSTRSDVKHRATSSSATGTSANRGPVSRSGPATRTPQRSPTLWSSAFMAGTGDDGRVRVTSIRASTNCTSSTPNSSR